MSNRPADTATGSNNNEGGGDSSTASLNRINYVNVVSYLLNFIVTYGVGTLGWIGNGNNAVLSEKYQTLVTPKATAFSIWAIIFIAQAIFAVAQCLPRFRSLEIIQNGVGYFYALTCLFQALWTVTFAYEVIWLSVLFMLMIWASLIEIVYGQYVIRRSNTKSEDDNDRVANFWLFEFPFAIHCGWITAASALNLNVLIVDRGAAADVQLAAGIVSLAILHAISVWVTWSIAKPNYTIAAVLAWANFWIYKELQSPKDSIVERFGEGDLLSGVSLAARAVAIVIVLLIAVRGIVGRMAGGGEAAAEDHEGNNGEIVANEGAYEPPQYGSNMKQSPGSHSVTTAAMDTPDLEGGR